MAQKPLKLIYIAGWGRSGSTLLARILAQSPTILHLGELRTIWVDGFKPHSRCGCGQLVSDCQVWQSIFQTGFTSLKTEDVKTWNALRLRIEPRSQELLRLFLPGQSLPLTDPDSIEYLQLLHRLYHSIQTVLGTDVIVDDSLHPGYAYLLKQVAGVELYIIHLIRDARGCGYSWSKRRKKGLGYYTTRQSAVGWMLRNLSIESLQHEPKSKFMGIRYEDFVTQPQETMVKILKFIDLPQLQLPFTSTDSLNLEISHSIFGNDNRLQTGNTRLKLDEVWREKMPWSDQLLTTMITAPLLLKYRYQL
ncbi:MAG: sulfotransferase [Prochlorotrichaceae cyanobacterium]|jgi:hypothetical protein